ncbi:hypothetical protein PRZ48_008556 [Zasmidium cellare]|uniref:F-box domain-containing protein n=1 Tax=Zasmidium cellare TaxID=395010 RepID=A0ABR0EFY1_ZASCE|nr:hypothetical protein PRZ48_008556 [Zasmidium cellare]
MAEAVEAAAAMDSPARDQVFSTPELAEMVFMELPPSQILAKLLRVCRQWNAVIEGSIRIQQALFFKPISGPYLQSIPRTTHRYWFKENNISADQILCFHPAYIRLLSELRSKVMRPKSFHNAGASWRRSLLSQPNVNAFDAPRRVPCADSNGDFKLERARINAPPGGFTVEYAVEEVGEYFLTEGVWKILERQGPRRHVQACAWHHD